MSEITKCTPELFGMCIREGANPIKAAKDMAVAAEYFAQFIDPEVKKNKGIPRCICGKPFTGLMDGTFRWGIAHGDGYCAACKHPARCYHRIRNSDGEITHTMNFPISYHPDELVKK